MTSRNVVDSQLQSTKAVVLRHNRRDAGITLVAIGALTAFWVFFGVKAATTGASGVFFFALAGSCVLIAALISMTMTIQNECVRLEGDTISSFNWKGKKVLEFKVSEIVSVTGPTAKKPYVRDYSIRFKSGERIHLKHSYGNRNSLIDALVQMGVDVPN